jgi:hypothetical protein
MSGTHNSPNPLLLTVWDSSSKPINEKHVAALKKLLKLAGAIRTTKLQNGAVVAKFETHKAMEKANDTFLVPLQILFARDTIDFTYGNPFAPTKRQR